MQCFIAVSATYKFVDHTCEFIYDNYVCELFMIISHMFPTTMIDIKIYAYAPCTPCAMSHSLLAGSLWEARAGGESLHARKRRFFIIYMTKLLHSDWSRGVQLFY